MKSIAAFVGALALASGAHAATYDAFSSFNGVQGAGGFSYILLPGPGGGTPSPLVASSSCVVTSDFCLQAGSGLPGAYKSLTEFSENSYVVPDDRLLVHPGTSSAIGIFFTAPEAGIYDYSVSFNVLDRSPSGVALVEITNSSGAPEATVLGGIGSRLPSLTRNGTVTLAQGQFLAFVVNNAGNYSNDSTGVNFTLTSGAVPEPASWALMIAGFGGAGAMLRRRRDALTIG